MKNFDCGFTKENNRFRYRAAAIIVEDNHVLFAGNELDDYYYSIGGAVHIGETAEDAVKREVYEETGVSYEIDHLAVIHENFFNENNGTLTGLKCHEICLYFLMKARGNNHPWLSMNDEEMLRSAGLILMDHESRREGITLAAILLFGKDISIMSALPQHKTDAIFRVENKDRYDDREIGLADELGSGMRNTYKYTKLYSGKNPAFEEGDIFKTIIPLKRIATKKVGGQSISDQVSDQVRNNDVMTKILGFCEIARTKKEISEYIGYKNLTYMTRTFIKPLLEVGKLEYTIPEKPQSRLQKYVAKK